MQPNTVKWELFALLQIVQYLRGVNFTTHVGDPVHFNQNGDPPASYDSINGHVTPQGGAEFATVGHFVSSDGSGGQFHLEIENVMWGAGSGREVRNQGYLEKIRTKVQQYYVVFWLVF